MSENKALEKINVAGSHIKAGNYPDDIVLEGLDETTRSWLYRLYLMPIEKRKEEWENDRVILQNGSSDETVQMHWDDLPAPIKPILQFSDLAELPSYEWLEDGFLPAVGLSIIYGKRGSGKSLFSFYLCAKYATEGYRTLYVATEGMRSIFPRGKACSEINGLDWESINENFRFYNFNALPTPRLDDLDSATLMVEIANQLKPNMVVFDIFGDTFSGDENSKDGMDAPIEAASKICHALDCAVILVHHAGKDATRGARGHSRLEDKAEVIMYVHAADKSGENLKGFVYVSCEKMREAEPFERKLFKIEQNEKSAAFKPSDNVTLPKAMTASQTKVYEFVSNHPNCGLSEVVIGANYAKQTVIDALKVLQERGEVIKTEKRKYVLPG